jgi:large-conductance mechanosensitive channel
MAHSIGMAVGFGFKELISSIINGILKPLIVYIITVSHLQEYYDFSSLIEEQKKSLSITGLISALLTFIMLIITVYFINKRMTGEIQNFS